MIQNRPSSNSMASRFDACCARHVVRSRDFQNRQTELVVIVTPYGPSRCPAQSVAPDDGFADASDPATVLAVSTDYGVPAKPGKAPHVQRTTYRGNYGFILD
jgi:pilus assembly protein CpaC